MPGATIGFVRLAAIQHRMGDLPGALATLKQAYRKGPTPQVVALLGWSLVESGQASDAVRLLMPYKEQPDVYLDAIGILGVALDKAGRHEEALSMLREVRRRAPADSTNLLNIAGIHLGAKEYAEAETAYKAALAVEPNLPQAHEFLGAIDIERGRFDSAIVHWKRVVSLDPKQYGTLLNLGLLLIQLGRPDEARPYLERFVAGAPPASYGPDIQGAREWIASREAARPKAH
jgi:tetratricopeptide (TPR) repeat protein